MVKKNVADLAPEDLKGKVVFVRADLNVPQVCAKAAAAAVAVRRFISRRCSTYTSTYCAGQGVSGDYR
jgi:3-phosphoglycerate kinase